MEKPMVTSSSALWNIEFKRNHATLLELVKDISQAESLLQPPFKGNCLNWVIGHILASYNTCQEWLDLPVVKSKECARLYGHGSDPMTDAALAWELADMLRMLDQGFAQLTAALENMPPAEMTRGIDLWMGRVSLIEALFFHQWHITYHTGQLEQLRSLAGKQDRGS